MVFLVLAANMAIDSSVGAQLLADSWETTTMPKFDSHSCQLVDRVLILPVAKSERDSAIALLEHSSALPLDEDGVLKLTGMAEPASHSGRIAPTLVRTAIDQLEKQRDRELNEKLGGWSLADQKRLADLNALAESPTLLGLSPFLVRAIAPSEYGVFSGSMCGDALGIFNGSLGKYPSGKIKFMRTPVVIFLEKTPKNVYLGFGVVQ